MTNEKNATEKTYRTLSDVLEMDARESMPIIARVAPDVEIIARKSGILKMLFNNTVIIANDPKAMAKMDDAHRAKVQKDMIVIGENMLLAVLKYGLGECLEQVQDILAAINGITRDELLDNYTTKEIIDMAKAVVTDAGFLASVRTLAN